jgi:hypothetical protein
MREKCDRVPTATSREQCDSRQDLNLSLHNTTCMHAAAAGEIILLGSIMSVVGSVVLTQPDRTYVAGVSTATS